MDYYVYNFSSFSTGSSWTLSLFKLLWYLGDFKYICKILQFPYLWTYTMKRYSVTWKFHEFYVDLTLFGFWNVTRFENITKVTTKNSLTENTAFFCILFFYMTDVVIKMEYNSFNKLSFVLFFHCSNAWAKYLR